MKSKSGILKVKNDSRFQGRATVDFASFNVSGDATGVQMRQVGGTGKFTANYPAYVVHFREYHLDDARGEVDEFILNSNCTNQRLVIEWNIGDNSPIKEIGFIAIG